MLLIHVHVFFPGEFGIGLPRMTGLVRVDHMGLTTGLSRSIVHMQRSLFCFYLNGLLE